MKNKFMFCLFLALIAFTFSPEIIKADDDNEAMLAKLNPGPKPKYTITVTQKTAAGGIVELGKIVIETFPQIAPLHCRNFDSLVKVGFYNGLKFHRVIPDFMIQGGDPNTKDQPKNSWGMGGPGQTRVNAEFSDLHHIRGIISQARRSGDNNSGTSQFFICHGSPLNLDGQYSIWGRVVEGMDIVDKIASTNTESPNRPTLDIEMKIVKN